MKIYILSLLVFSSVINCSELELSQRKIELDKGLYIIGNLNPVQDSVTWSISNNKIFFIKRDEVPYFAINNEAPTFSLWSYNVKTKKTKRVHLKEMPTDKDYKDHKIALSEDGKYLEIRGVGGYHCGCWGEYNYQIKIYLYDANTYEIVKKDHHSTSSKEIAYQIANNFFKYE